MMGKTGEMMMQAGFCLNGLYVHKKIFVYIYKTLAKRCDPWCNFIG